jgi:hypothetical protein
MTRLWLTANAFAAAMLCALPGSSRELVAGSSRVRKVPGQGVMIPSDGDIVRMDPGTDADCAIGNASRLLIEAAGPGVHGNLFRGDARFRTAFVRNSTRTVPELFDNTLSGNVQTLE